jgi:uncharacterized protein YgbK (DUF1537 family)
MGYLNTKEVLSSIPSVDEVKVEKLYRDALDSLDKKIVVLDDDPTGVQTVHGVAVITDWEKETLINEFNEDKKIFFVLTNSRGFTAKETEEVHKTIAENIQYASEVTGKEYFVISRGDSTLRGHYPLETEVLRGTIENLSGKKLDGEIIMPFFKEGGRLTIENTHYVDNGKELVPAGETEFAKDRTFGYTKSNICEWVEEKTNGEFLAKDTIGISLESLRNLEIDKIADQLMNVKDFNKVVVNAVDYVDIKIFCIALIKALNSGKDFMYRTAAAFTKIVGGITDKPILLRDDLVKQDNGNGGLIIVGSHVKKTTEQLYELMKNDSVEYIEFDCHLVLKPIEFKAELERVIEKCDATIGLGKTCCVYTKRERLDLGENKKEEELKMSVEISDAVTSIVARINNKPNYVIAKGGITSSDVGTKGLKVKKAIVAGQIKPGIPVWTIGDESRFPGTPYVIFPGNVGSVTTFREAVEVLEG